MSTDKVHTLLVTHVTMCHIRNYLNVTWKKIICEQFPRGIAKAGTFSLPSLSFAANKT